VNWDSSYGYAANLLPKLIQSVFRIKGLKALSSANRLQQLQKRLQEIMIAMGILKSVALDEDEDYQTYSAALSGVDSVLTKFDHKLAAAADGIPLPILLNQNPTGGLGDKSDLTVRQFYDRVKQDQTFYLTPALNQLIRLLMLSKEGPTGGRLLEGWSISWCPLQQMDALQASQIRKTTAEANQIEILSGVLNPEEVRQSQYGGDGYTTDIILQDDGGQRGDAAPLRFPIPKGVQTEAKQGLDLSRKFGRGGTEVGRAMATVLSRGGSVTEQVIRKIASYFPRHAGDNLDQTNPPSNGLIAWKLWGGDPGREWAEGIVKELDQGD
jgi:hypothetical protein